MKLSRFNQYAPGYPTEGQILVHNTLAGSFAVLPADAFPALVEMNRCDEICEVAAELIDAGELDHSDIGIVVRSFAEEDREFLDWFERQRSQTDVMEVIVGLNLACNFACSYCCQDKVMNGSVMSEPTVREAAEWIAGNALEHALDSVHLTFIGGEPLLHPGRLIQLVKTLEEALRKHPTRISFGLVTNGYFFDTAMVDRLLPFGLTRAQITLDGDGSTHSKTRISRRGEDTFERILSNAVGASKRLEVSINGNYQADTIHGFAPLLDRLHEEGLTPDSQIKFSPALSGLGAPKGDDTRADSWAASTTEFQTAFHDEILRHGFHAPPPATVGPCSFHRHHAFAIGPHGNIYKCPAFLGEPTWDIGHVRDGLSERYTDMIAATPQSHCGGCAHRPNCGGGCVADAMLKANKLEGVSCEKGFFDRNAFDAVPRLYQRALHADPREAVGAFPDLATPLPTRHVRTKRFGGRRSVSLPILGSPNNGEQA